VSIICSLQQLETDSPQGALNLFNLGDSVWFVLVTPLRDDEASEGLIAGDVD
jgi:hypothetical protein